MFYYMTMTMHQSDKYTSITANYNVYMKNFQNFLQCVCFKGL